MTVCNNGSMTIIEIRFLGLCYKRCNCPELCHVYYLVFIKLQSAPNLNGANIQRWPVNLRGPVKDSYAEPTSINLNMMRTKNRK